MNYQQFTYSLIRAESGNANTQPIAVSQPYLEIEPPQMESSACCCCCCCCQNSICCQCMCHYGMCCQGNCQLMPTTLTSVNVQEQVAIADELNPPKTTRHIRRDKSSIQIKPNAIDTTNTRLNLKLKGSQSSHNIFKNNNMSSYNRDTYTTYNRQERHPQLSPSTIENERCNNDANASLPNVAVPPLNAQSEGMKHRSKSFVNVVNTTSDGVYSSNNNNNVDADSKQQQQRHHSKNNRNSNDKIKYDLENFNQELLALKRKLANGKKSIPKYPASSVKVTTSNSNNTLSNEAQNDTVPKHSNYNNLNMYYPKDNTVSVLYTKDKDNTRNNNNNIDSVKGKPVNNSFRGNNCNKNQIPNGHCVIPVNKTKSKHTNNKKQHFSFTIFGENPLDTNNTNVNANVNEEQQQQQPKEEEKQKGNNDKKEEKKGKGKAQVKIIKKEEGKTDTTADTKVKQTKKEEKKVEPSTTATADANANNANKKPKKNKK